ISYAAICIAMSFALSYLRIVKMPQGGSVTIASLLPLMIYSYMFGTKKGVFAGFVYGVLQAVQDPWIIHPAQFLLDYPVAFAAIGLAGMFAQVRKLDRLPQVQFALGALVASVVRFISHVLSGVFAFNAYAFDAGMNPWAYSLAYNSFVFIDIAIVIAVGILIFSSKTVVKEARKFRPKAESAPAEENATK
ncbi:MAG: energy-coupled thiamine transporter ThiT, partial [Candidatus Gallimonas sp.]